MVEYSHHEQSQLISFIPSVSLSNNVAFAMIRYDDGPYSQIGNVIHAGSLPQTTLALIPA